MRHLWIRYIYQCIGSVTGVRSFLQTDVPKLTLCSSSLSRICEKWKRGEGRKEDWSGVEGFGFLFLMTESVLCVRACFASLCLRAEDKIPTPLID